MKTLFFAGAALGISVLITSGTAFANNFPQDDVYIDDARETLSAGVLLAESSDEGNLYDTPFPQDDIYVDGATAGVAIMLAQEAHAIGSHPEFPQDDLYADEYLDRSPTIIVSYNVP